MYRLNLFINFSGFILKRASGLLFTIILLFVLFYLGRTGNFDLLAAENIWKDTLDPLITLATLIIAILVWWFEARQAWLSAMPNKLTARFLYDGNEIMRCEYANLTSESDIRALGQQIGSQMAQVRYLELQAPSTVTYGGTPERNKKGEIFQHWKADFPLNELPPTLKEADINQTIVWCTPFSNRPTLPKHPKPNTN